MTLGTSQPNDTNRGKEMRFMRRIIMALILACLVAFAVGGAAWVLVAPPPAKAAFPGQNGRIVFYREDSDGFAQTWVADKDLSNQVKLTSESADSGWAVWKPGGAKLAFESNRRADPDPTDRNAINDIFTMNPDGSGIVKLTHSEDLSDAADWSPSGKKLVFEAFPSPKSDGEVYTVQADGEHLKNITDNGRSGGSSDPVWSPNGHKILFSQARE